VKNLAPEIFRQRLLIEGFYTIAVTQTTLQSYLFGVTETLSLRAYGEPVIFSPASGMGKEENQGFDAFLPLIDSGIAAYIWSGQKFFSIVIYTCKGFDEAAAIDYTRNFFQSTEIAYQSF
jgi:S-adenosylmethionine/arginine decarboxylase-like enzyme